MDKSYAIKTVIETGLYLQKAGLVARTWGNISQRLDEDYFAISPSGIFYENIREEHISFIKIKDHSWEGSTKPSSEKNLHANIYRDHPQVKAIIHTHQPAASSVAAARMALDKDTPCVPYALPTTKALANKTAALMAGRPWRKGSLLLANHGAICTGSSMNEAIEEALTLEVRADNFIKGSQLNSRKTPRSLAYAKALSLRDLEDKSQIYQRNSNKNKMPVLIQTTFTENDSVEYILWSKSPYTMAFSETGQTLKPLLDDMAQLIGIHTKCYSNNKGHKPRFKGMNALFIKDEGALCTGLTLSDAKAAQLVLEKSARSCIESSIIGKGHIISLPERYIMRLIYLKKYSRMNENLKERTLK